MLLFLCAIIMKINESPERNSQSTTNKMQRFTIYLVLQDAVHVSDNFSVHHQELKTAQYSVRYFSDRYCYLLLAWLAGGTSIGLKNTWRFMYDDGRKNCLKHVERLTEINKLWNVEFCWLYCANILAMHGPVNVKSREGVEVCLYDFFNLETR